MNLERSFDQALDHFGLLHGALDINVVHSMQSLNLVLGHALKYTHVTVSCQLNESILVVPLPRLTKKAEDGLQVVGRRLVIVGQIEVTRHEGRVGHFVTLAAVAMQTILAVSQEGMKIVEDRRLRLDRFHGRPTLGFQTETEPSKDKHVERCFGGNRKASSHL